jgi:8-oxo-dGTP diphosphatase
MDEAQSAPSRGVSIVILDDNRILLQQRADFRYWSLPGGRIEPGETHEEAAVREVLEEIGLQVKLVRVVGNYWKPQHNDRVTVFQAVIVGGQIVQRSAETLAVRWFERNQLPWLPSTIRQYIEDTLANHSEPVEITLQIPRVEVLLRKLARRVYRLMNRS